MRFEISHVDWNISEKEIKKLGLPTDDFEIELDFDLEDEDAGPTEEEFDQIDGELREAIADKYGVEPFDFGWGFIG